MTTSLKYLFLFFDRSPIYQMGLQLKMMQLSIAVHQFADHKLGTLLSDQILGHVDGGQGRVGKVIGRTVIITDDTDIIGNG